MNKNNTPKKIKKVRLEKLNEETRQTAPSKSRMSIRELSEAYKDKTHSNGYQEPTSGKVSA